MKRICQMEGPLCDAVTRICTVVMNNAAVFDVLERIDVRDSVVNNCIVLDPYRVMRPERLSGVASTDAVFYFRNRLLTRTNDDMVEILMVAIPDDGVRCVLDTRPFAFPFAVILAVFTCVEPRINQITQYHRIFRYLVLADEGGVVLAKGRSNMQGQNYGRVTTICRRVGVVIRVAVFRPDRVRILAA